MWRNIIAILAMAATVLAQTIHLTGDSTMAAGGHHDGTEGWGQYLHLVLKGNIVNYAVAGSSARSYTNSGRFKVVAGKVVQGDWVVMEFGHNDGGGADCNPAPKTGYATTCNGVLTYYTYLVNAAKLFQSKGAKVIISSSTPDNLWETNSFAYTPSRFVAYARDAARASGSDFVDHQAATADLYKSLGASAVKAFYPHDHTHTSPAGARAVAQAFVTALKASGSALKANII